MCSFSRAFLHFYAQGFSAFVSHSQKHTHLQNTCIFTYIRKYVRVHTYFHHTLPQAVGSLVSISCYAYIHMHKHTHTYVHKNTCTYISFLFQFLLCLCFATALALTHSYSQSATSNNKNNCHNNNSNKNNNNTTTTTLRHYVSKRTHTHIHTERQTLNTHTHALWQNTMREGEALYTRALTLYAAPICPGKERAKKKERARAFKHPEDSLSFSSCRRPKIYKQISLNTNN